MLNPVSCAIRVHDAPAVRRARARSRRALETVAGSRRSDRVACCVGLLAAEHAPGNGITRRSNKDGRFEDMGSNPLEPAPFARTCTPITGVFVLPGARLLSRWRQRPAAPP